MATLTIELDQTSLRRQTEALGIVSSPQAKRWMQQAMNTAGRKARTSVIRQVQAALPVKRKYIASRVKWWNQGGNSPGKLRIYGIGSRGGKVIRPRHMKPRYQTERSASVDFTRTKIDDARKMRAAIRRAKKKHTRSLQTSFGVGGIMPQAQKQVVPRGFAVAIDKGPRFVPSYRQDFSALAKSGKMQIFQGHGNTRKITMEQGVSVGAVARKLDIAGKIAFQIQREAKAEYGSRISREIAAARRKK